MPARQSAAANVHRRSEGLGAQRASTTHPSTVFWVAVVACTVVMRPSTMPKLVSMTLAKGARQLVVHDALDTTCDDPSYILLLTPMTYMGASAEGADITTFFALQHCQASSAAYRRSRPDTNGRDIYPPDKCAEALSVVVKTPDDSTT